MSVRLFGARGVALFVATVVVLLGAPRVFVAKPTSAEAESAIRAYWSREASAYWMPRLQSGSGDSARTIAGAMGDALRATNERPITDLSIRRTLVGPPFAKRWAYVIRYKTPPRNEYGYFRMARGFGGPVSSGWWAFPLF